MGKAKAVLLLIILIAVIAGVWLFLQSQSPTSAVEARLNSVFQKHGLVKSDFNGSLLVRISDKGIVSVIPKESLSSLKSDLQLLSKENFSAQGNALVSLYLSDAELSIEKLALLERVEMLSKQNKDKNSDEICSVKGEIFQLQSDFEDFYVKLNLLGAKELNYAVTYNVLLPLNLSMAEESDTYSLLNSINSVIDENCTAVL